MFTNEYFWRTHAKPSRYHYAPFTDPALDRATRSGTHSIQVVRLVDFICDLAPAIFESPTLR